RRPLQGRGDADDLALRRRPRGRLPAGAQDLRRAAADHPPRGRRGGCRVRDGAIELRLPAGRRFYVPGTEMTLYVRITITGRSTIRISDMTSSERGCRESRKP